MGKRKGKGGRPRREITAADVTIITKAIRAGLARAQAAALAGISQRTFMRWVKRGNQAGSGPYFEFCQAQKKAEAEFIGQMLTTIVAIGMGKYDADRPPVWTALAWTLERRFPGQFGRRDETTIQAAKGQRWAPLVIERGGDVLPPVDEAEGKS